MPTSRHPYPTWHIEPIFFEDIYFLRSRFLPESNYQGNLNDLRDLDEALYQGLLQLKNYPSNVEDMGLSFEVTDTLFFMDRPSGFHSGYEGLLRYRRKTSSNKKSPQQVSDAYYTSLSQEFQKTPKTSRTSRNRKSLKTPVFTSKSNEAKSHRRDIEANKPPTSEPKKIENDGLSPSPNDRIPTPASKPISEGSHTNAAAKPLEDALLTLYCSFWGLIKESQSSQGSPSREYADDDISKIMKRLNNQIDHQMNNKVEIYGYNTDERPYQLEYHSCFTTAISSTFCVFYIYTILNLIRIESL
ncbi:MAG: hypothetical protein Q9223_007205 [Gallowayella weberi]